MTQKGYSLMSLAAQRLDECKESGPVAFWTGVSDGAKRTVTAPTRLLEIMLTPLADRSDDALACQFTDGSWALEATAIDGNVGLAIHPAHPDARLLNSFTDAHEKTEVVVLAECSPCKGTGLYQGYTERNGMAVVCRNCGGNGVKVQSFIPFLGRREKPGVERVMSHNPGISLGNIAMGVSYAAWLADPMTTALPGNENRDATCPAWWYQGSYADLKQDWQECRAAHRFPTCKFFPQKARCWERFDHELGERLN